MVQSGLSEVMHLGRDVLKSARVEPGELFAMTSGM